MGFNLKHEMWFTSALMHTTISRIIGIIETGTVLVHPDGYVAWCYQDNTNANFAYGNTLKAVFKTDFYINNRNLHNLFNTL